MTASGLAVLAAIVSAVAWALVAEAVVPDSAGWVQAEAGLWVSALLALGVTASWHTSRGPARTAV